MRDQRELQLFHHRIAMVRNVQAKFAKFLSTLLVMMNSLALFAIILSIIEDLLYRKVILI